MTGLKSGSGDDLWGDDESNEEESEQDSASEPVTGTSTDEDSSEETLSQEQSSRSLESTDSSDSIDSSVDDSDSISARRESSNSRPSSQTEHSHSYIVRRAIQDKSVQFERDERLTFFVHDDVMEGERDLVTDLESTLGRDIPKFDIREAVYRAALRNQDDVLEELLEMGYSQEE